MQCNMTKDNLKTELPAGVDKKIKPNLEIMTFEFGKNKRELQPSRKVAMELNAILAECCHCLEN